MYGEVLNATKFPPTGASYQINHPAETVASKFTVPGSHLDPGAVLVTDGIALTVAVTAVLLTDLQDPLTASA